ncbi:hypothetical protein [Planctomycetes bacterium K23_9]|uniref:Uncharacterized protein n=1 Tax=Stieleria marina TaxID=1930275 RepID=A0A517P0W6_9BACT|nr:hypothetical protein K239x_50320 [Planctomycetes bacterium K23_9]
MVNYRGPRLIRPLVRALGIAVFDRITEINSLLYDPSSSRIERADLAAMDSLERVSMIQKSAKQVSESNRKQFVDRIPPCRLGNQRSVANQVDAEILSAPFFLGCAD